MVNNICLRILVLLVIVLTIAACGGRGQSSHEGMAPAADSDGGDELAEGSPDDGEEPPVDIEPEVKSRAEAFFSEGDDYRAAGDFDRAFASYVEAVDLNPDHADAQNNLCWVGSLIGLAAEVMDNCERAVMLATDKERTAIYRDSRGVARALTEDYEGAIEDFWAYALWTSKDDDKYAWDGKKREQWIKELQAGHNPFDEETLAALKE